tara:strand:+ start:4139 stop:4333 length:195 start_codon:yes stop_codon:yes gene_type:complete
MAKQRKVQKDKKTGIAKKYLSGISGSRRASLARVLKQIKSLSSAGKRVPASLIKRRLQLGKKKK